MTSTNLDGLRLPPHNEEAERAVVGAVLLDPTCVSIVQEILLPWMFYVTKHRRTFEAMLDLAAAGQPIDNVTLTDQLMRNGNLKTVGGSAFLGELIAGIATAANVRHHAALIRETALLRKLRELGLSTARRAEEPGAIAQELLDELSRTTCTLSQGVDSGGFVDLSVVFNETIDAIEKQARNPNTLLGVPSGFSEVDAFTGGLQRGELTILAARPSMGKTALALSIATSASKAGRRVAIFSLEMSRTQLGLRLLGAQARINIQLLKRGLLTPEEWERMAHVAQAIVDDGRIHISDGAVKTIDQLQAQTRMLKAMKGIDLLIVDYLGLLQMSGSSRRESRQQEVSDISRALKLLARDLNVPVLALSQLSRAVEARKPPIPMLADLRDSGAIEQDADVVMFIYREEVYNPSTEKKGIADILIQKHRNGPLGQVPLFFEAQFATFKSA